VTITVYNVEFFVSVDWQKQLWLEMREH